MMNTIPALTQASPILPPADFRAASAEHCCRVCTASRYRIDRRYDGSHDAQQLVSCLMSAHRQ